MSTIHHIFCHRQKPPVLNHSLEYSLDMKGEKDKKSREVTWYVHYDLLTFFLQLKTVFVLGLTCLQNFFVVGAYNANKSDLIQNHFKMRSLVSYIFKPVFSNLVTQQRTLSFLRFHHYKTFDFLSLSKYSSGNFLILKQLGKDLLS